jgi:hypothetical protein
VREPVEKSIEPLTQMIRRLYLAWRLHSGLHYSWRLAWHKATQHQAG